MREVVDNIKQWFVDRGLDKGNPQAQIVKLLEESGELAGGVAKHNEDVIKDSIGDTVVVLIGLSMQLNVDFEECVKSAYNEIKDRKGKLVNGVFIKDTE